MQTIFSEHRRVLPIVMMLLTAATFPACDTEPGEGGLTSGDNTPDDGAPSDSISGSWTGSFESDTYGAEGDFSVKIVQDGTALSGAITIPMIDMNDVPLSGKYSKTDITFGDISGEITFKGTVTASDTDTTAKGTYTSSDGDDVGTWKARLGG